MNLIHGKNTTIPKPAVETAGIGGGLFVPTDTRSKLPPRYDIVGADKIDQLLETAGSVLGSTLEVIQKQLEAKHPSPTPWGTHLYHCHVDVEETDNVGYRHRYDRRSRRAECLLVLNRPYIDACISSDELVAVTQQVGPVYVNVSGEREEELSTAGFTCVVRRFGLTQVNFNPRQRSRTQLRQSQQSYAKRRRLQFSPTALIVIYDLLRPQHCHSVPCELHVPDCYDCDIGNILSLVEIYRKLGCGTWWRKHAHHRGYMLTERLCQRLHAHRRGWGGAEMTLQDAFAECLQNLHAQEEYARANEHVVLGKFCHFLRREAKAMGIPIPKKPQPPKPPSSRKSAPKGRRGARPAKKLPAGDSL